MTMRPGAARKAFTLIEAMFVVVIGCMLVMLAIQWQARFSTMFSTSVADLALQSDARLLFDYMSTDLTSAVLVATGKQEKMEDFEWKPTGAGQTLAIVKLKKDPRGRHTTSGDPKKPAYEGYPTYTDDGEPTVQKWPATRVLYETEADPGAPSDKPQLRIHRTEEEGTFQRKEETPRCDGDQGWSYSFVNPRPITRRELKAKRVTSLAIVPLAFLPKPPAQGATPATPAPGTPAAAVPGFIPPERWMSVWKKDKPCAQLYHISALGVHYISEDVKQGATGTEGKVELVCKYYIEERSAAYRFNTAFSSVDENL